ncbi:tripartite multidrug resistance system inner membrane protein [Klebsiella pneumoniae]|uniref:Tripartite multidrug resistance system inner membrane protein n=1 Tax=Klebsiella pneumoniae TaxID=573 RepID=A0A378F2W6_KLEPN|nr:tripartite multidrug resistance system inner membrane protein [Klebsiella pneumoniae]
MSTFRRCPSAGSSDAAAKKIFAFASMCVGMFIALIDIQIVSASLRDIGGGLSAGDDETVGYKPAT